MGMPVEKSMTFGPSAKRLLARLSPHRLRVVFVVLLGVASVVFTVLGPQLLGDATNIIFEGAISKTLPPGTTKAQIIEQLRASGDDQTGRPAQWHDPAPGRGH